MLDVVRVSADGHLAARVQRGDPAQLQARGQSGHGGGDAGRGAGQAVHKLPAGYLLQAPGAYHE